MLMLIRRLILQSKGHGGRLARRASSIFVLTPGDMNNDKNEENNTSMTDGRRLAHTYM